MSIDGAVQDMDLIVIAYPEAPTLTFMMTVVYSDEAISRLEYGDFEEHNNGWLVPQHIRRWKIRGPHFHKWEDNREFATRATLPVELEYAILLPQAVRGFPNTFRWFCGQHNVRVIDVPDYPGPELLV